jgi:IMP dehydrogenase
VAQCSSALEADLDILVIQGTVVSAEHVQQDVEPLNLKEFIRDCSTFRSSSVGALQTSALHLMRTGAVGVLVGVGPGHACTTRGVLGIGVPQATGNRRHAARRCMRHLDETGVYVPRHRRRRRCAPAVTSPRPSPCGADAVMIGSPLASAHEAPGTRLPLGHGDLPPDAAARSTRVTPVSKDTLEEILSARRTRTTARWNLFGALRTSMATCGYETLKGSRRPKSWSAPDPTGKGCRRARHVWQGLDRPRG